MALLATEVNGIELMEKVSPSPPSRDRLCKPNANEMYRRFRSFIDGGPRVVIPDVHPSLDDGIAVDGTERALAEVFTPGTRVEILNLLAKPELNGHAGVILRFDQAVDRYEVLLADGQPRRIKSGNLRLSELAEEKEQPLPTWEPGMLVRVQLGIEAWDGTLVAHDTDGTHWRVLPASGGAGRLVRTEDLRPILGLGLEGGGGGTPQAASADSPTSERGLVPGARVRIVGLRSRSDLNRQEGTLVEFVKPQGRWRVRMDDDTGKSIQAAHLEPLSEPSRGSASDSATTVDASHASAQRSVLAVAASSGDNSHCSGGEPSKTQPLEPRHRALAVGARTDDCDTAAFTPGAWVRIRGLSARPELNDRDALILGFDECSGRWIVELDGVEKRLRSGNLQVTCPRTVCEPVSPGFAVEIAALPSADAVLALCERESPALTIADVSLALRRMARCPDQGLRRADTRMPALLARLRALLEVTVAPRDISELFDALEEFEMPSIPLLEVLSRCCLRQIDCFAAGELARVSAGFAALSHTDIAIFDALAAEAVRRHCDFPGTDIVTLADAFARVKLRHFEMLDQLAIRMAPQLGDLSDADLVRAAVAFSTLDALCCGSFLDALCAEAKRRAGRLELSNLSRLATSLSTMPEIDPILNVLAERADKLVDGPDELDIGDLAALLDALPSLRRRLGAPLVAMSLEVGRLLQSLGPHATDEDVTVRRLRSLPVNDFGVMGTRCALNTVGVHCCTKAFVDRALNRISWASSYVEDWNIRTVPKRSFGCAEYRLRCSGPPPGRETEGICVRHDGMQPVEKSSWLPSVLSHHCSALEAERCVLFQVLCEVGANASSDGVLLHGDRAQTEVIGSMQVFLTELPGFAGLLAVSLLNDILPMVTVTMSIGPEAEFVDAHEVMETDLTDAVLDINNMKEFVEAVD